MRISRIYFLLLLVTDTGRFCAPVVRVLFRPVQGKCSQSRLFSSSLGDRTALGLFCPCWKPLSSDFFPFYEPSSLCVCRSTICRRYALTIEKGRGKTWGSFEAQSLPLAEGGRDGETEKGGRDPSLEPFLPVTYTVERSYALVGACTQAHKGASHECLIKEEGERGWRRRRGIHQGVTTPLPEQRRQIGTIAVECLSGERGPCKRAGVLILAKKKPPADSPWHHAPLPPSPSLSSSVA